MGIDPDDLNKLRVIFLQIVTNHANLRYFKAFNIAKYGVLPVIALFIG